MKKITAIAFAIVFIFISSTQQAFSDSPSSLNGVKSSDIETNFLNLSRVDFKVSNSPIVVATEGREVWVSERESNVIKLYEYSNENILEFKNQYVIGGGEGKFFILDLYKIRGVLFVSYVKYFEDAEKCDFVYVTKIDSSNGGFGNAKQIFKSAPCLHWVYSPHWTNAAGRMTSDGKFLYLTGGLVFENMYTNKYPEGSMVGLPNKFTDAVKSTNLFGGIAKIDLKSGKTNKIVSGLRMPQGLWWSTKRKILFETEQGPRGGDELNVISNGKNYGWPYVSLGRVYDNNELQANDNEFKPKYGSHFGFEPPIFSWTPSIAVSHIIEIPDQSVFSDWWRNSLVTGSLKDLSLHRLALSDSNKVIYDERIFIGMRIRDLDIETDCIVLSTDEGNLIFLSRSSNTPEKQFPKVGSAKN
jgi:hypothetical protein